LASCVHCFCSCVSPRAPRSTLFPYTTLFRSAEAAVVGADDATTGQAIVAYVILRESAPEDTDRLELIDELRATVSREISPIAKPDRKSTRLNSSHVSISYAVFCLKKKKRQHT